MLLKRRAEQHKPISRFNYQSLCVELTTRSGTDCVDCTKDLSCCILRSVQKIPATIHGRNTDLMKVRLFNGQEISQVENYTAYKSLQHTKTRAGKMAYAIIDGRLELYGNDLLKYIVVEGPFNDPTDLVDFHSCGSDNTESCYDIRSDNFPIEESLVPTLRELVYKELSVSINLADDTKNDSTPNAPNQI